MEQWFQLPGKGTEADGINGFKHQLEEFLQRDFIWGYAE